MRIVLRCTESATLVQIGNDGGPEGFAAVKGARFSFKVYPYAALEDTVVEENTNDADGGLGWA